MRKLLLLCGLSLLAGSWVMAQEYPKGEVSLGYQYVRINPGGGASGINCNGGGASVAGNLNSWFGVAGEFGGCTAQGGKAINYLFGPRFTYRSAGKFTPFANALFGGVRISDGTSDNSFAMALGGGADYSVTEHVAIRLIEADYFYTKFGGTHQNNARIQAGIVFRFGGR